MPRQECPVVPKTRSCRYVWYLPLPIERTTTGGSVLLAGSLILVQIPTRGYGQHCTHLAVIVPRKDLIELLLNRGADPDFKVGNCGNTIRELVLINRNLYTNDVLSLFGIDGIEGPSGDSSIKQ